MSNLDRRTFLRSAGVLAGGAFAFAACGSDGGSAARFDLAPRFPRDIVVTGRQRLVYSLVVDGALQPDGPDTLTATIRAADNSVVASSLTANKRRVTDELVYWDFHTQLETPGIYTLFVDGATSDGSALAVYDAATIAVPTPGQPLPPFDTPTTDDARGVDPICTRMDGGPCPFHSITLTEALALGKPVAYMIGTPAHCQFGTCAPGMEFLIASSERLGDDLVVVHAEVYTDDSATVAAPAMDAYSLAFEPVIYLADASGTIVTRLDGVWNQAELDEALDALVA